MYRHPLAKWTPIAFNGTPEPTVMWADLRAHAFEAPFFRLTVAAWRVDRAVPPVRTDLSVLAELDDEPSLNPDLIIAHPSRSGSTLLARLAAAEEGTILVSEPGILLQLLNRAETEDLNIPIERAIRAVIRAYGRIRCGTEKRFVLKLNSQATRFLPVIRRAFPETPVVWLQRSPQEILASNLRAPPQSRPARSDALEDWLLRRVTLAFLGASAFVDREVHVLDYRDLPEAAWTSVPKLMRFDLSAGTLSRMHELTRRDSRTGTPFSPQPRQPLPDALRSAVIATLDPLYAALDKRREH